MYNYVCIYKTKSTIIIKNYYNIQSPSINYVIPRTGKIACGEQTIKPELSG